jgi:tRNA G10  N-methylase Trm11
MIKISDRTNDLSVLISPRRDINRPIYNWHAFKHSYSKELVDVFFKEFDIKKNSWVLDPFCGGGTTLLACKQAGINSHGFDVLPFSVFLTNVKTKTYDLDLLQNQRQELNLNNRVITDFKLPSMSIADAAFSEPVLKELVQIKAQIDTIAHQQTRDFFNLAFLGILGPVSKTSKAGGFLRIVDRRTRANTIKPYFLDKLDAMISDVKKTYESEKGVERVETIAYEGDARELDLDRKYSAVITSPPYPNRHDYTRIYALEMIFDFINHNDELKQIRYDTLRSHVEAKKKYDTNGYRPSKSLKKLVGRIEHNGVNNPQVIGMLYGYFEDMYLALSEMKKSLTKKGKIALVVSNVRFSGVNVPVDELLSDIGKRVGLKSKGIWKARHRGNSPQQMKDYKRKASRESVVIWEK